MGRRKSDRWFAWTAVILFMLMSLFVIYTSYEQGRSTRDQGATDVTRMQLLRDLQDQNKTLMCFADNAQGFQQSVARYLIAQESADPTERGRALAELQRIETSNAALRNECNRLTPTTR